MGFLSSAGFNLLGREVVISAAPHVQVCVFECLRADLSSAIVLCWFGGSQTFMENL